MTKYNKLCKIQTEYLELNKQLHHIQNVRNKMNYLQNIASKIITIDFIANNPNTPLFPAQCFLNDDNFWKPLNKDVRSIIFSYLTGKTIFEYAFCRNTYKVIKIKEESNNIIYGTDIYGKFCTTSNYVKYNRC